MIDVDEQHSLPQVELQSKQWTESPQCGNKSKIIVAFDGSRSSLNAFDWVIKNLAKYFKHSCFSVNLRQSDSIEVVVVIDSSRIARMFYGTIARFYKLITVEKTEQTPTLTSKLQSTAESTLEKLESRLTLASISVDFNLSILVKIGDPRQVLCDLVFTVD